MKKKCIYELPQLQNAWFFYSKLFFALNVQGYHRVSKEKTVYIKWTNVW